MIYAGTPFPIDGRRVSPSAYKDRVDLIIDLVYELIKKYEYKITLDIFGISKKQYTDVIKTNIQW